MGPGFSTAVVAAAARCARCFARAPARPFEDQKTDALSRSARPSRRWLGWAVQRANLVAVRVAQVCQVELAARAFAVARWVFAGGATVGHTGCVERIGLLGRLHGKADGAAIGKGGGLAIDGGADAEGAGGAPVEVAVFVGDTRGHTNGAEQRVVELPGHLQIVHTDHHMTEHSFLSP